MRYGKRRISGGVVAALFSAAIITASCIVMLAVELEYMTPIQFEQPEEPKKK